MSIKFCNFIISPLFCWHLAKMGQKNTIFFKIKNWKTVMNSRTADIINQDGKTALGPFHKYLSSFACNFSWEEPTFTKFGTKFVSEGFRDIFFRRQLKPQAEESATHLKDGLQVWERIERKSYPRFPISKTDIVFDRSYGSFKGVTKYLTAHFNFE